MNKIAYWVVIQFLHSKGLTPKEIHENMMAALQNNAPSYSMDKKWTVKFKRGRDSLEDESRQGKPVNVTTQEIIDKIHDMVLPDQSLTECYISTEWASIRDVFMQLTTAILK